MNTKHSIAYIVALATVALGGCKSETAEVAMTLLSGEIPEEQYPTEPPAVEETPWVDVAGTDYEEDFKLFWDTKHANHRHVFSEKPVVGVPGVEALPEYLGETSDSPVMQFESGRALARIITSHPELDVIGCGHSVWKPITDSNWPFSHVKPSEYGYENSRSFYIACGFGTHRWLVRMAIPRDDDGGYTGLLVKLEHAPPEIPEDKWRKSSSK